jgi:hypothetical protein
LSCSQSGDHPENNLAKRGYMLDTKVGKKKRRVSMLSCGYLLEVIIKILMIAVPLPICENLGVCFSVGVGQLTRCNMWFDRDGCFDK